MAVEVPTAPAAPARAKVGKFDHMVVNIGKRGSGKSVFACQKARELQAEAGGAYILGHSIGQRIPRTLPDGTTLPLRYHRNVAELAKGLKRHPNDWNIIAPPLPDEDKYPHLARSTADDLIHYAIALSAALRADAWRRANPLKWDLPKRGATYDGLEVTPIILLIDEGVAVGGAAAGARGHSESTDWFREFLISLRHCHIAVIMSIQSSTMKSWHILGQATEINVFQTDHQYSLNAIDVAGASDDDIERIRALDLYEHVTIYPGAHKRGAGVKPPTETA